MDASVHQTIIGSDNGLSPVRYQAIIRTSAVLLFIEPIGTYFNVAWMEVQLFPFKKMNIKMSIYKMAAISFRCYWAPDAPENIQTRKVIMPPDVSMKL